ncbi:MAG: GMC family oxidoreductase [Chryseobacterium sp.]|nr:MAG: GMC family oxidoreductase [Chryseobacterium sp.]
MSQQNNNLTKKDVIIVGTGIAGSLIAKLLTDHVFDTKKGKMVYRTEVDQPEDARELSVLMFEAGLEAGLELDSAASLTTYNEYIRKFYMEEAKVPNSPYPNLKQAPSPDVLDMAPITPPFPDKKGYLVQFGPMPFASDAIRVGGGTTLHWLGTTPRMLPNDFYLNKKYGRAMDWPINYDILKPYYEMAEFEIGVSGNVAAQEYPISESMEEYYGKDYVFPMEEIPQSYMDQRIIDGLAGTSVELNFENIPLTMVPSPQGRNSTPNPAYGKSRVIKAETSESGYKLILDSSDKEEYKALGSIWNPYMGERCEGNASCVPICPVQAKYNALKTLKKALYKVNKNDNLQKNQNIQIQAQSVVYKLSVDQADQEKISKVHLRRYISQESTNFIEEVIEIYTGGEEHFSKSYCFCNYILLC